MLFDIVVFSDYLRIFLKYAGMFSVAALFLAWVTGYLSKIIRATYGFVEEGEVTKFSILSVCFGFIIGFYWMLRTTKDGIFFDLVGRQYLPKAKMITPFMLFVILFLYNMIVDKVKKHRLFMVVCFSYGIVFALTALFLKIGIPHVDHWLLDWIPGRVLGWVHYLAVETLGGIIVGAVFWAFVASTTRTESAKRGYPMVFLGAQIGNLVGPAIVASYSVAFGTANLLLLVTMFMFMVPFIMEFYMKVVPAHLHESDDAGHAKKKNTGALEGLRLLATKPFLIGIAIISTVYEVVGTIIDYQFKILSSQSFPVLEEFNAFMALYAMNTAVIGILFAIVGTTFLIQRLGVKLSLLGYPLTLGLTVLAIWFKPSLAAFFIAMILVKALSYALNNPLKEFLYLPTSKDVKMKAKGFIDGFGSKGSKAVGSFINDQLKSNMTVLINYGSLVSLGIIGGWILVALVVGNKYDELIKEKKIIE